MSSILQCLTYLHRKAVYWFIAPTTTMQKTTTVNKQAWHCRNKGSFGLANVPNPNPGIFFSPCHQKTRAANPITSPLNMKANTKDQCLYCKFLVHFSQSMKKEVTLEERPRPAFEQFSNCTNVHHFYFPNVQFKGMEEENITAICQPRCLLATRSQWSTQSITFIVSQFAREICLLSSDWSIVPVSQWGKSGQGIPQYGSIPS